MTSFQIGPTIRVGELRLTVIEKTSVEHHRIRQGIFLQARKEPYAIVVRNADAIHAVGMDGAPMSVSELVEKRVWSG